MKRHSTIVKPGDYESALSVVGTYVTVLAAKNVTRAGARVYISTWGERHGASPAQS